MNWAIVIPAGIGIAVLLSIALVAIDVSGQISRQEELDEVEFYWDSMFMYSKRVSPDAPPDYEAKTLYENRKDFCAGFCNSGTGDNDTAATATMYTVLESSGITPQFESPNAPTQFGFHSCKDGSYGMGDFLGMRKTEKDDENEVPH